MVEPVTVVLETAVPEMAVLEMVVLETAVPEMVVLEMVVLETVELEMAVLEMAVLEMAVPVMVELETVVLEMVEQLIHLLLGALLSQYSNLPSIIVLGESLNFMASSEIRDCSQMNSIPMACRWSFV
jgi:hypothetical protein